MNEAEFKLKIRKELQMLGAKCLPIITGEMTERGTPDIVGCYKGRMFLIEAKIEPNTASKIQQLRIEEWSKAGAFAFITSYPTDSAKSVANYVVGVLKW